MTGKRRGEGRERPAWGIGFWEALPIVEAVVAQRPLGLLTDVDGTLSEIAASPGEARVSPEVRRLLASLTGTGVVVAAVSGRPAREVRAMVGVDGMIYFGNHGLESLEGEHVRSTVRGVRKTGQEIREVLKELRNSLEGLPGLIFEDKGLSASVHYRLSRAPREASGRILDAAERYALPRGLVVRQGRMVVDIRPKGASKGAVVRSLVRRFGLKGAMCLGDDDTDVDAFEALHRLRRTGRVQGLAVAVRSGESPERLLRAADLYLDGIADVLRFLRWLNERLTGPGPSYPPTADRASG